MENTKRTLTQPPTIPSAEDLYNMLMEKIEPELTTGQLSLLEEKYKDETVEDRIQRAERYKEAFMQFHKDRGVYMKELDGSIESYYQEAMSNAKLHQSKEDIGRIQSIENSISSQ